jgi:hypothetical protein
LLLARVSGTQFVSPNPLSRLRATWKWVTALHLTGYFSTKETDMKNVVLSLLLVVTTLSGSSFSQQQPIADHELIVGYYGRPGVTSLGVLGQHSIAELMPLIKSKADEFSGLAGIDKVTPAFHLIYGLAASDPGRDKDYLLPLAKQKLMEYINAAQSNGFLVIIDTQLGKLTPVEAVKPVLEYLKYESVHLAIDPEFEVNGLDVRPGKVIGHVSGEQINQVQSAMTEYLKDNGISQNKILIVHRFTENMISDRKAVKLYDQIDLVMNLDGHGSPQLKVNTYNALYAAEVSSRIAGGFKLFFLEDKPSMMTPKQVLGLEAVGGSRIKDPPTYINYQ